MSSIANYLRITGLQISNDDVTSRTSAATALGTAWAKLTDVNIIITKASEVAQALGGDGTPPISLAVEAEKAIQKKAPAYLHTEGPLQVGIVAAVGMQHVISQQFGTGGWNNSDVYAVSLWLALSFQPTLEDTRREELRQDLLNGARDRSVKSADFARKRIDVPDFGTVSLAEGAIDKLPAEIKRVGNPSIDALRRNAALDREEIDFLWWVLQDRSRLMGRQFSKVGEVPRVIAAALESSQRIRRLPCEANKEMVLRHLDENPNLNLHELLEVLGEDRSLLSVDVDGARARQFPSVFPILNAILDGTSNQVGAEIKRPLEEWGGRCLLEAGLVKMWGTGAAKL